MEKIARLVTAFAEGAGAPGVVLLCFENLEAPDQHCQREVFAAWWREQTGEEVVEL